MWLILLFHLPVHLVLLRLEELLLLREALPLEELVLRLLLETLLLLDAPLLLLRPALPDTPLLLDEPLLLLRLALPDTLLLLDELLLLLRELETEAELLREALDELLVRDELTEPVDLLLLFTVVPVVEVRRVELPVLLLLLLLLLLLRTVDVLRFEVLALEALSRRVAVVALLRLLEAVPLLVRLFAVFFVASERLEPVRVGVFEVTAVRRFSSESTFTTRLLASREGMFTNPALRSRRLFS